MSQKESHSTICLLCYSPSTKDVPPAFLSTAMLYCSPQTSKSLTGVMCLGVPTIPSFFNRVKVSRMATYAGAKVAKLKIMIRKPISRASPTVMMGLLPFSTEFNRRGHGARSLTACAACSFDENPSRSPTSAPSSLAARSLEMHSSYPSV